MQRLSGGIDYLRALGVGRMIHMLKQAGWDAEDLKQHVALLKEHSYRELDEFAGGELRKLEGTPPYELMLELTALRFLLGPSNDRAASVSLVEEEAR